jgi:hypothetical protein
MRRITKSSDGSKILGRGFTEREVPWFWLWMLAGTIGIALGALIGFVFRV